MTPENIAGLTIPEEQLQELIVALAAMQGPPAPVVVLRPELDEQAA
jgi:hypothetical protein